MPYCAVRWCGVNNMTNDFRIDNITFHRFPKTPALKQKWVEAIRLRKDRWYPSYSSVICSRHFKDDCFEVLNRRKRLLETAIPTQHLILAHRNKVPGFYAKKQEETGKPRIKWGTMEIPIIEKISDGKIIISKVFTFLEAEFKILGAYYGSKFDLSPLSDILARTAEATGVTKFTVSAILNNERLYKRRDRSLLKLLCSQDFGDEIRNQMIFLKPKPPVEKVPKAVQTDAILLRLPIKPPAPPSSIIRSCPDVRPKITVTERQNVPVPIPNAPNTCTSGNNNIPTVYKIGDFVSNAEVENIIVEPDIDKLCLLQERDNYTPVDENLAYTCDVQIHPVRSEPGHENLCHFRKHDPDEVFPLAEITPVFNTKRKVVVELDTLNNNIKKAKTVPVVTEIKMKPPQNEPSRPNNNVKIANNIPIFKRIMPRPPGHEPNRSNNNIRIAKNVPLFQIIKPKPPDNEQNRVKVSIGYKIWKPVGVDANYKPRNEFCDYYSNFMRECGNRDTYNVP